MQDSSPSHCAKATQNFLRDNTPDFISSQKWTPHSPDLNLLDYSVWDILQELFYKRRREPFVNLKDLQNVIRDKWHDVNDQTVRKAILQWKMRLAAVAVWQSRMEDLFSTFSADQLTNTNYCDVLV